MEKNAVVENVTHLWYQNVQKDAGGYCIILMRASEPASMDAEINIVYEIQ